MRDYVSSILNRAASGFTIHTTSQTRQNADTNQMTVTSEQPPQASHVQLNIEELINSCQQGVPNQENSPEGTQEESNMPTEEEIASIMDVHFEPTNIEESVESVILPEEVERDYDSIIIHDETARFSSAEWFANAQRKSITLAGIGGIGSWTSLLLSRLRPVYIDIYDGDRVELVNLAGQMYGVDSIGNYKTDAMVNFVRTNANFYSIYGHSERFNGQASSDVMICGFDNMQARRQFFNTWKRMATSMAEQDKKELLFIDGRLTATEFQVFCITGEDTSYMSRYEREFLFGDEEASQEICSFKQTAYLANMIAGTIVNLYVNFCANLCGSPFKKALPFLTKYNTDMMMLNTEY